MTALLGYPLNCTCDKKSSIYVYNTGIPTKYCSGGKKGWCLERKIDKCVASLVDALNGYGVYTQSSCCGHGTRCGEIFLADGRILFVLPEPDEPHFKSWNRQLGNLLLRSKSFKFRDFVKLGFSFLWSRTVDRFADFFYWWSLTRTWGVF